MIKPIYRLVKSLRYRLANIVGPEELDSRISVGIYTYGVSNQTVFLVRGDDKVQVGKFCSFAPEVKIFPSGEHNIKSVSTFPFYASLLNKGPEKDTLSKGKIVIGNDVWVGYKAAIMSGVSIGDGAVIAAGSVVIKNVPPYAIVSGVPAAIKGYRFSRERINKLLKILWWDWDTNKIIKHVDDFYMDIEKFLIKHSDD